MRSSNRLIALHHLRGFVVALVVLLHAILAYCQFGHVDRHHYLLSTAPVVDGQRWIGFDVLVLLNDSFFMPLMFLVSGLFVLQGLSRKGGSPYLHGRMLRLGVPFAVAVLTVVPLANYPSWLQAGGTPGFTTFWATMVTTGPWPSGPPWFVAVLLIFDGASTLVFVLVGRWAEASRSPARIGPALCFGSLLSGSLLAYLPLLAAFGPSRWVSLGPIAIQGSRIGLYAVSFGAGVVFSAGGLGDDPMSRRQTLAQQWPAWSLLAMLGSAALIWTALRVPGRPRMQYGLLRVSSTALVKASAMFVCALLVIGAAPS